MELRGYIAALRKGWWIIVLVAAIGGAAGYYNSSRETKMYAAHVAFYISTPDINSANAFSSDQFAQDRANSYAQLLSGTRFTKALKPIVQSNLPPGTPFNLSAAQLARKISGAANLNTIIVTATVKDSSTTRALAIAEAVSTEFPAYISSIDNFSKTYSIKLVVFSDPSVGLSPVSPRTKLNVGLAFGLGLLIGLAIAVVRQLLDVSIRTSDELAAITEVPVIGSLGYYSEARKQPLIVGRMLSVRAEEFRQLRTSVQFVDAADDVDVLAVTSSIEGEGKSTISTNLALVFAESGARVLLIEADLRRPKIATYLSVEGSVGLSNVLAGQLSVEDALQPWGEYGLMFLASGSLPPNPSELLGSSRMRQLLERLRGEFDLIVIDTPPLLPVTDAAVLGGLVDGTVVVFRHGKTKRVQIAHTLRSLRAVNARVIGCVLNMRPVNSSSSYGPYGYYGQTRRWWQFSRSRPEVANLPAQLPPFSDRLAAASGSKASGSKASGNAAEDAAVSSQLADE